MRRDDDNHATWGPPRHIYQNLRSSLLLPKKVAQIGLDGGGPASVMSREMAGSTIQDCGGSEVENPDLYANFAFKLVLVDSLSLEGFCLAGHALTLQ
jgi:hypothetical protein